VTRATTELYGTAVALLVAMAAGSVLVLAFGESPGRVYGLLLSSTWGDAYGIGQVLFKATPLVFTGLSVAVAFRAGLFNIGAEGQMIAGAFATGVVGASLSAGTPSVFALPLALVAGVVAGGAVGAVPGILKARFGAHEVINTIMLNFIVAAAVLWMGTSFAFAPETTHTAPVASGARIGSLGLAGSAANWSTLIAAAAAVGVGAFFGRTRAGFEWRVVGASLRAAEAGGVRTGRAIVAAMAAAGALAGLVGANTVLGYKHYFEDGIGRGAGFMGIAVALLGRNHPAGVVAAALLFGTLSHGGLAVNALVPKELIDVLQAVIILAVAATSVHVREAVARRGGE